MVFDTLSADIDDDLDDDGDGDLDDDDDGDALDDDEMGDKTNGIILIEFTIGFLILCQMTMMMMIIMQYMSAFPRLGGTACHQMCALSVHLQVPPIIIFITIVIRIFVGFVLNSGSTHPPKHV